MIVYGISTCDSCKKALKALKTAGYDVQFRDIRQEPLSEAEIDAIVGQFGERAINKTSPTYRSFSAFLRESDTEAQIAAQPTAMKRPIIEHEGVWSLGWREDAQAQWAV